VPMKKPKADFPILAFAAPKDFGAWLKKHHASSDGIWLKFYKKGSGVPTVNYAQALDEALCWGWIDSQTASLDAKAYLQKFTPRRAKSIWSQNNREHVARLIRQRRMRAPGRKQVDLAKADGRWDAAYAPSSTAKAPADFLKALSADKKAKAFYATLNRANTYAMTWRIHHAKKAETRARRIAQFVKMLSEGKKLH
jgi:uncharacterized protein YdeI (YjbR/CyaY-like superfamily)